MVIRLLCFGFFVSCVLFLFVSSYEQLIVGNPKNAITSNLSQQLWRDCFYSVITMFRKRLEKISKETLADDDAESDSGMLLVACLRISALMYVHI